jgi:hypothetical protein
MPYRRSSRAICARTVSYIGSTFSISRQPTPTFSGLFSVAPCFVATLLLSHTCQAGADRRGQKGSLAHGRGTVRVRQASYSHSVDAPQRCQAHAPVAIPRLPLRVQRVTRRRRRAKDRFQPLTETSAIYPGRNRQPLLPSLLGRPAARALFKAHSSKGGVGWIAIKNDLQLVNDICRQIGEVTLVLGWNHDLFGTGIHGRLQLVC